MKQRRISILTLLLTVFLWFSCDTEAPKIEVEEKPDIISEPELVGDLPKRLGPIPTTTSKVPHIQVGVSPVPEVHEEMIRRIYSVPGIEDQNSVIGSWRGLRISEDVTASR